MGTKRSISALVLSGAILATSSLFAQGAGQAGGTTSMGMRAGAPPATGQAQAGNIEVPWNDKIPPVPPRTRRRRWRNRRATANG